MNQSDSHVFTEAKLQQEFEKRGFVRFQILNSDEVKRLLNEYQSLPRPRETGFHCTMFSPDSDLRKKADRVIKEFLVEKLSHIFLNQKPLYGNFMVKEPGVESDWFVHQDWAYVDETQNVSVAVWIPLVDLTEKNGVLCVVPGSHKIPNMVRGPGVTDPWTDLHQVIKDDLHEKVYLKAGEAIIWHHRLVHFSPPNMSEKPRVAATVICVPIDAQILHYWQDPTTKNNLADAYSVDNEFFMNYVIGSPPLEVKKQGWASSFFPAIDENQLRLFYARPSASNFTLVKKLKHLLSI